MNKRYFQWEFNLTKQIAVSNGCDVKRVNRNFKLNVPDQLIYKKDYQKRSRF